MKKLLLIFGSCLAQMSLAQIPALSHSFTNTLVSPGFSMGNNGIGLDEDRSYDAAKAAKLAAGHDFFKVTLTTAQKNALLSNGTISLWYKHEGTGQSAFGTNKPLIFWSNGGYSYSEGIMLGLNSAGRIQLLSYLGNNANNSASGQSFINFPTSGWNHIAISWTNGPSSSHRMKVYLNGVEVINAKSPFQGLPSTSSSDIFFTGFNANFPSSLYGSIDEIKVYTEQLSDAQILSLFSTELPTNCVVNIPDANFKNALLNYNTPKIDVNNDGKIQCLEAEAFQGILKLNNKNISDLTGLEAFKNLGGLQVAENNLTKVDVSNHKRLNEIWVSGNQLTSLNVANGNNTNFVAMLAGLNNNLTCIQVDNPNYSQASWVGTYFSIPAGASYSTNCAPATCEVNIPDGNFKFALLNHTPTIDTNGDGKIQCTEAEAVTENLALSLKGINNMTGIEAFKNIKQLFLSDNNLTTLDLSANTALTNVDCSRNKLTSINLGTNTALRNLYIQENQLTSVDVSANTGLSNLVLNDNNLTNLDVSSNTALSNLGFSRNQISQINLSANSALNILVTSDNPITSLDLSSNPQLYVIDSKNSQLSSLNLANGNNSIITDLYIQNNPNLTCVQVDNVAYSNANWTDPTSYIKDSTANYSEDCSSTLGTNNIGSKAKIAVYPNPTKGIAQLSEVADIQVFDASGRLILTKDKTKEVDLTYLKSGVYFIKTKTSEKLIKIIKD